MICTEIENWLMLFGGYPYWNWPMDSGSLSLNISAFASWSSCCHMFRPGKCAGNINNCSLAATEGLQPETAVFLDTSSSETSDTQEWCLWFDSQAGSIKLLHVSRIFIAACVILPIWRNPPYVSTSSPSRDRSCDIGSLIAALGNSKATNINKSA